VIDVNLLPANVIVADHPALRAPLDAHECPARLLHDGDGVPQIAMDEEGLRTLEAAEPPDGEGRRFERLEGL
jgi:hypothetical protein